MGLHFLEHLVRLLAGRAGRELRHGEKHAGVFIGHEAGGRAQEKSHDRRGDERVENERSSAAPEKGAYALA
jgi:hypothetical protein